MPFGKTTVAPGYYYLTVDKKADCAFVLTIMDPVEVRNSMLVESDQFDALFQLATIDCTLTAADVYEKVLFDAADADEPFAHD